MHLAQVLEVLADDSNFRGMAMELSAAPAAAMLTLAPESFDSAWCAGEACNEKARSGWRCTVNCEVLE